MHTLWQDLRYGARLLFQNPGFTAAAVVCLALGIGANTTVFSLVDGILLRPFVYPDAGRLLVIQADFPKINASGSFLSGPEYAAIRTGAGAFSEVGAYDLGNYNLTGVDEPERLMVAYATANVFSAYGVQPMLGRALRPDEREGPGGSNVVVISHRLWERRFGSNPGLVGQKIQLNSAPYTVVGVLPPRFVPQTADLWVPLWSDPATWGRNQRQLIVVGRLKAGATAGQAGTELETIARRLEQQHGSELREYAGWRLRSTPIVETTNRNLRLGLLVLLGAVAFVLLIACVNVANLLLARGAARDREMAIRAALGAGRGRLVRQLLTESCLLAAMGGVLGVVLAMWGLDLLLSLLPAQFPTVLPSGAEAKVDGRVLGATAAICFLTALLFGLAPAWRVSRPELLRVSRAGVGASGFLVVSQVALAVVLLAGAGLMTKSFRRLQSVSPGFSSPGLLMMRLTLPRAKYQGPRVTQFFEQTLERVSRLPGVAAAGFVSQTALFGFDAGSFAVEGLPAGSTLPTAFVTVASNDYFRTLGVPLLRGRAFGNEDTADSPGVIVINDVMARRYWPDEDPVGKRIQRNDRWFTVVGVVAAIRNRGLDTEPGPEFFTPLRQDRGNWNQLFLFVRTRPEPMSLLPAVRQQIRGLDPDQPVYYVATMEQVLSMTTLTRRVPVVLLGSFALLALLLAVVGIYSVMACLVTRRTPEIGVRMALGARPGDVLRLILGRGLGLTAAGLVIGLAGALALTRVLATLLFQVSPTDPVTFAGAALLLGAAAALACYVPARRAARVDPVVALRYE